MNSCSHLEKLEECGLRKTRDRHEILKLFDQDRAWTAEQAAQELTQMDLSTVYRNIKRLVEKGLLEEVPSRMAGQLYGKKTGSHHDHAVCPQCGVAWCIDCPINHLENHFLELIQTCSTCNTL